MTKKQRIHQIRRRVLVAVGILFFGGLGVTFFCQRFLDGGTREPVDIQNDMTVSQWEGSPPIEVELLTPNSYSRPQIALKQIRGIVIHYTANPGSTAEQNRDYFEGLKDSHTTKASSHFIVGLDGEVVQCIPSSEWAYASNDRNKDTLSIECCHPDESGKFTDKTYQSLVQLAGWLSARFHLSSDDVIRHYDVTGKLCPKYYVEHEEEWEQLKEDIAAYADSLS